MQQAEKKKSDQANEDVSQFKVIYFLNNPILDITFTPSTKKNA